MVLRVSEWVRLDDIRHILGRVGDGRRVRSIQKLWGRVGLTANPAIQPRRSWESNSH